MELLVVVVLLMTTCSHLTSTNPKTFLIQTADSHHEPHGPTAKIKNSSGNDYSDDGLPDDIQYEEAEPLTSGDESESGSPETGSDYFLPTKTVTPKPGVRYHPPGGLVDKGKGTNHSQTAPSGSDYAMEGEPEEDEGMAAAADYISASGDYMIGVKKDGKEQGNDTAETSKGKIKEDGHSDSDKKDSEAKEDSNSSKMRAFKEAAQRASKATVLSGENPDEVEIVPQKEHYETSDCVADAASYLKAKAKKEKKAAAEKRKKAPTNEKPDENGKKAGVAPTILQEEGKENETLASPTDDAQDGKEAIVAAKAAEAAKAVAAKAPAFAKKDSAGATLGKRK